jgi:ParB-like nuclease family protein
MARLSDRSDREAEANYWVAVSLHHQTNPGYAKLALAKDHLDEAISLSSNAVDVLRFETEKAWLSLLMPYHRYLYGALYEVEMDAPTVLADLIALTERFVSVTSRYYDPIEERLGIHIYAGICLLCLFTRGFTNPILADPAGHIIAGHGRLQAARAMGLTEVPTIILSGLSKTQKRALRIVSCFFASPIHCYGMSAVAPEADIP